MDQEKDGQPENGALRTKASNRDIFVYSKPKELDLDANSLRFGAKANVSNNNGEEYITTGANKVNVDETSMSSEEFPLRCFHTVFSWRAVIYLLLHLSLLTLNLPRTSVNMAIVCVTTKRAEAMRRANESGLLVDWGGVSSYENLSWSAHNGSESLQKDRGTINYDLNWDSSTVGLILSGQYFLSCLGPIVFDTIRQRVGGRLVITFNLVCTIVLMVTSPILARASPYLLLINQVLLGLTMNGIVPVIGAILPLWTPENQRLTATAIVFAGYNIGSILSAFMNGFLCSVDIDNGWPFIFYISAMILTVSTAIWFFLMADSPEKHPFISEGEKTFIQSTRSMSLNQAHSNRKSSRPPYRVIIKSVPVLAYIISFSFFMWTQSVAFVYIPIYLSSVHGLNAKETGIIFAVVCCIRVAGSFAWTLLGNFLTNSGFLSQHSTRKACICTGLGLASMSSLAVSFFDHDNSATAIALIMVTMFFQAVCTRHLTTIPMEVAPRFAGTVMSLGMSVALLVSLSGPLAVANLTPTNSYSEWRIVWYVLGAVFLTACLVFLLFGQAEIQPWAAKASETVAPNNELEEQLPTEISVVHSADFSGSDKITHCTDRVSSLDPVGQSGEFGNPYIGESRNGKSLNNSRLETPNHKGLANDNAAFEKDAPQHLKSMEFQAPRSGIEMCKQANENGLPLQFK